MAQGGLNYYQDTVGVEDGRTTDTSVPRIGNIGGAFDEMAGTILNAAEPFARDHAEKQALTDAGSAEIVKDPDTGQYTRANLTHGGGLVYARAYKNALDVRQVNLMSIDYEEKLNAYAQQNRRDPVAFTEAAHGAAEGMLELAPPELRPELEQRFGREMLERARGIGQRAAEENHNDTVRDLGAVVDYTLDLEEKLIAQGLKPGELEKALAPIYQQRNQAIAGLQGIGEWSADRQAAFNLKHGAQIYDAATYQASQRSLEGFAQVLSQLTDYDRDKDDLSELERWLKGVGPVNPERTIAGMHFDDIGAMFPHNGVRSGAASLVSQQSSQVESDHWRMVAEQRAAEEANKPATAKELITDFHDNNLSPALGKSVEEVAGDLTQLKQWGPVADQLQDPQARARLLGWVSKTGIYPPEFGQIVEGWMAGTHMPDAVDFVQNVRTFQVNGIEVGMNWYRGLPAPVRAAYDRDEALRRGGVSDPALRQQAIAGALQGKEPGMMQIWDAFGGRDKYAERRRGALAAAMKVTPERINSMLGNQTFRDDFDELLQANFLLNGGKFEPAFQSAVTQSTNAWKPSALFANGLGDARIVDSGLDLGVMNVILKNTPSWAKQNSSGARFGDTDKYGQPRVLFEQLDAAPGKALGQYSIKFFSKDGSPTGAAVFDMDRFIGIHGKARAGLIQRQREAAKAKAEPPRTIMGKNASGHYGYVVNPEWQAWHSKLDSDLERARAANGGGYVRK